MATVAVMSKRRFRVLVAILTTLLPMYPGDAKADTLCEDGWVSPSDGGPGTCSWHGGIYRGETSEIPPRTGLRSVSDRHTWFYVPTAEDIRNLSPRTRGVLIVGGTVLVVVLLWLRRGAGRHH